jgi:2-keto-4-pentenoate hydratase/2-oxohepta-3-ene-1,7-dioic acid hydratase in catechol pathway
MSVTHIVRLRLPDGEVVFASPNADGKWQKLAGDLATGFTLSETVFEEGELLAPVAPPVIFGIGLNYKSHAQELGRALPEFPLVFLKQGTAAQDPEKTIELPRGLCSDSVDYEGELAVVIGKPGKNIPKENAYEHVAGYCCAIDVSARDWQFVKGGGQFSRSKTFDTFCPLGPVLVTPEALPDPHRLGLKTLVNGELRQRTSTGDLIFDIPTLIHFLSGSTTLQTGTVILTGTPGGTGNSFDPPKWLQPGDTINVTIDELGTLTNPIVAEPLDA